MSADEYLDAGLDILIKNLSMEWGTPNEEDIARVKRVYTAGFNTGVTYMTNEIASGGQ